LTGKPEMKHTALEIEWDGRKIRIGSCVPWTIAIIMLAWTGHLLIEAPATIPAILKWVRGG